MATKKMMGCLFERNRYPGGATAKVATPKNRSELMALLGGASKVHIHARVYDRGTNSPAVDVIANAGCMGGDEPPGQGLRLFALTATSSSPTLPWSTANMTSVPDDGYCYFVPTMGLCDIVLSVSGSGATWVEIEVWYTAEFAT